MIDRLLYAQDGLLALERFAEKFNWKKFSIISHSMVGYFLLLKKVFTERKLFFVSISI